MTVVLDHVSKRLGRSQVLDDVSVSAHPAEALALVGPNGSGKSTLLAIAVGLRSPDGGSARIFGRDPRRASARVRLGYVPQEPGFPPTLRVRELVQLVRSCHRGPEPVADLLEGLGLHTLERSLAGGLSGGQRRSLALALALAGRPSLLVLDEPTAGLDAAAREQAWRKVARLVDDGATIVLATHSPEEVRALGARTVTLVAGRVRSACQTGDRGPGSVAAVGRR